MGPRPIETRYRGRLFRSRLEAKWAVVFETLSIPWIYEPEGFQLPSGPYLPDFRLPRQKIWVEVKPGNFEEAKSAKAEELAAATGDLVWIVMGDIPIFDSTGMPENSERKGEWGLMVFPDGVADYGYCLCRCPYCGEIGIQFDGRAERIGCCAQAKSKHTICTPDAKEIIEAYSAARTRRFEHGFSEWD